MHKGNRTIPYQEGMRLSWSEMTWYLKVPGTFDMWKLGEAENSSYRDRDWVTAMRIGDEVYVQCPTDRQTVIIDARVVAHGFRRNLEDMPDTPLSEFLEEGKHYRYELQSCVGDPPPDWLPDWQKARWDPKF